MLITNNPVPTMPCNAFKEHSEHACSLLAAHHLYFLLVLSPLGSVHSCFLAVKHLITPLYILYKERNVIMFCLL